LEEKMPHLGMEFLGGFRVTHDGYPLTTFESNKVRALLVYLATESQRPHPRETLAALLWPDWPDRAALSNLRYALSDLRKVIGDRQADPPFLLISRESIQLNRESDHHLDVVEFARLSGDQSVETLDEAVKLYQGDFLEGFSVSEAAPFDDWARLKSVQLRRSYLETLHRLASILETGGEYERALGHAHRVVEVEPLDESGQRQVMRLLALSGRRAEALAQYEACCRVLKDELKAEPSQETEDLYQLLLGGELPPKAVEVSPGVRTPRRVGVCPYRGLAAFREQDTQFFFGREQFTQLLEDTIQHQSQIAVIVGSSGSGKSSGVYAGLLPKLRAQGGWQIINFRPGQHPFHALAGALLPLLQPELNETERLVQAGRLEDVLRKGDLTLENVVGRLIEKHAESKLWLLVIDQSEELYTLCPEPETRRRFLDELLGTVSERNELRDSRFVLLLTLRADFMGQALSYRPFADALQGASVLMGPMNREELRSAVEKPAELQGAAFETGLVDRLLDDVGEEPGNLPLLEFTLTQLWEQQTDGWLTHANYEAMGGVEGALSSYADQVYASLQTLEQARARRALVQLVQPGEGTEDTRRIATRQELGEESWILIQRLADRRLVVTGRDAAGRETAEVVHEALIQKWERFQTWMGADRAFRLWEERLRSNMRQWQQSDQDEGALLRGAPLAEADAWAKERPQELSQLEAEYIQAGISLRERHQMERERRRQRTILALAAGLVLVAALGVIALLTGQRASRSARLALAEANTRATAEALAVQERQNAQLASTLAVAQQVTAQANAQARATAQVEAEAQRAEADAQRHEARKQASIGLAAMALRELDTSRQDIGVLLALEALEKYPYTWQAEQALGQAVLQSRLRLFIQHEGPIRSLSWSPDGKRLLTASDDGTARVWSAATGELLLRLDHKGKVRYASWSPDGSQILTNLEEPETLILWDGSSGERSFDIERKVGGFSIFDARWSPDGERLAIARDSGIAWILDAHTGEKLLTLSGKHVDYINNILWSPSGDRLLTTSFDSNAVVWDAQTGAPIYTLRGHREPIFNGEWSPSGDRILTSSQDGTVKVWDAATGKERLAIVVSPPQVVVMASWSPSGESILAVGGVGPRVYDAATGEEQLALTSGKAYIMGSIGWSPAGDRISIDYADASTSIWDATSGEELFNLRGQRGQIFSVYPSAWSPDGERLATGSNDGSVMVWDVRPAPSLLENQPNPFASWSPAGDRVMTVSDDGTRLWDASTLTELLANEDFTMGNISWSPSGDRYAQGMGDGRTRIFDAATGAELLTIPTEESHGWAYPSWSPDGSLIAIGTSWDGSIRIWDAHTGAEKQLLHSYASEDYWDVGIDSFWGLSWSPSGDKIYSFTKKVTDSLRVWDATTGRLSFSTKTKYVIRAAWSPDGKRIATFDTKGLGEIWDAESGENLLVFTGHTGWVNSFTWSPSGERIASGGVDGVVLVWDTHSGLEVLRYPLETQVVGSLDWSPDGSKLLLSYEGKVVILPVWNTAQELIDYAHACCAVRALSPEDRSLYGLPPAGSD
jgi:WD40 repeat protein/DNA-binding SARP family transcriptional activator